MEETASRVESQLVEDPPSSRFTWTIKNFSRLNTKKHYSETFFVGGYKWRLLIYPKGNNVDHLSMYLDVADSKNLPYGWSRYAQFSLAVVSQIPNKYTIRKRTLHQFNARESDWGFTSFIPLNELYDPGRGYLVNDTFIVEAKVAVRGVVKDTEGVIEEALIAVEAKPEVEAMISAEGITEEPAIANDGEVKMDSGAKTVAENEDTTSAEVPVPESDSTPAVSTGTAPEASIMAPIAPAEGSSEMPSNDQVSEAEVTTESILVEENQIDNSVELPTDEEPIEPSLAVPPPYSPSPSLAPPSPARMNSEELDSIVNKYPIAEAHKSTWRDIVKKYGDITYKSNIKNLKLKAAYIETICGIISGLKGTAAQGLKMTSINQCESDLEDVEITKMDVSWLKERLHMLKTILAQSRQFSVMDDSFKVNKVRLAELMESIAEDNLNIENARKEIVKQEALIVKQEALIMESQESLNAKKNELKAVEHAITSQDEEFVRLRTAAEKLLYYGTMGFTQDLL